MIKEKDRKLIIQYARKYKVSSIILFGSSLTRDKDSFDIDLAVKGIDPRLFFKFYAELYKNLSKPVDLIDLSDNTSFNRLIEEDGVRIYSLS